jgi:hypothetical protein
MTRVLFVSLLCLLVTVGVFAQTPPSPTNLTAEQINVGTTTPTVKLMWQSSPGNWGFRVYRSAIDTSHFQSIGTVNTTMFYDHMVVVGTRYYYYVKAVNGNLTSGPSNVVDILISAPPPPTPPPTPTDLTAALMAGGPNAWDVAVKLNWRAPRGQWDFRIYRSPNDTSHFMSAGSTRDTFFVDHSVVPGTRYFYYVKSVAGTVQSGRSNVVDILVVAPPRPRGVIRGTVIDDSTSAPIRGVNMQFFRLAGPTINCPPPVFTDSLGRYVALLDTGRYIVRANAMCSHNTQCYRPEYYDNCLQPSCATVIAVAESSTFVANFGLSRPTPPRYAYVSGSVMDTLNHPLRNARVSLIRTVQEMNYLASLGFTPGIGEEAFDFEGLGHTRGVLWSGWTDSLGHYRARVVADRKYLALASKAGYLPQYFNHKPTAATADSIFVTRDTAGIDFNLLVRPIPNNSISGSVRDSGGIGVPSRITLLPARYGHPYPTPTVTRYGHTDSLGNYTLTGVEAGKYFVLAMPFSNYAAALYKANGCGVIRIQDADTVDITGNITGINICVKPVHNDGLTLVRGTVRSTTNSIVAGARIFALDVEGEVTSIGITDARGMYELNAVAPGLVTVVADQQGYGAAQLSVTVNANVYGLDNVNITMSPSSPTSVGDPGVVPEKFALDQNYPNPFNPDTKISYSLSAPSVVTLTVFNILGQEVATLVNGNSAAGIFQAVWNGKDNLGRAVASGVYMYKLHATAGSTEFLQTRKMLLLK